MTRDSLRPIALLVLAAAVLAVAGCGGDDEAEEGGPPAATTKPSEPIRIAFVSPLANTFTSAIFDGAKAAVEEANAAGKNVQITSFDPGQDPQKEYNVIQDIVAQGRFDGITLLPLDPVSIVPAVEDAIEAGVEVVSFNNPLGPREDTIDTQVKNQAASVMDASQYQRGVWMGEMAIDACADRDPCEVAYLAGFAFISGEKALIDGFRDGIKGTSNIKIVSYLDGGEYTPEPSRKVIQNLLTANRDIDLIATSGDQMTRGAELAVNEAGLTGQVTLLSLGGSEIGVQSVLDGKWYGTVVTLPFDIGRESVEILLQAIDDQSVNEVAVNVTEETGQDPKLTKENAGDFKPQWTG